MHCLMFAIITLDEETYHSAAGRRFSVFQSHLLPPPTKHVYFQELGAHGKGQDFISLGLQNGHLVFR